MKILTSHGKQLLYYLLCVSVYTIQIYRLSKNLYINIMKIKLMSPFLHTRGLNSSMFIHEVKLLAQVVKPGTRICYTDLTPKSVPLKVSKPNK